MTRPILLLIAVSEASRKLGISDTAIKEKADRGELPCFALASHGGQPIRLFTAGDIAEYQRRHGPGIDGRRRGAQGQGQD